MDPAALRSRPAEMEQILDVMQRRYGLVSRRSDGGGVATGQGEKEGYAIQQGRVSNRKEKRSWHAASRMAPENSLSGVCGSKTKFCGAELRSNACRA